MPPPERLEYPSRDGLDPWPASPESGVLRGAHKIAQVRSLLSEGRFADPGPTPQESRDLLVACQNALKAVHDVVETLAARPSCDDVRDVLLAAGFFLNTSIDTLLAAEQTLHRQSRAAQSP